MTLKNCIKKKKRKKKFGREGQCPSTATKVGMGPTTSPNRGNLEHVSGSHGEMGPSVQLVLLDRTNF